MAAKIDLGGLKRSDTPQVQADLLRILEGALNSSDDPATAAANLVTGLRQFFLLSESEDAADTSLWNLWMVLLAVVMTVPIEHPWHAALIAAVKGLQSTNGPVAELEGSTLEWTNLPNLTEYMLDKWADPTELDDYTLEDLDAWKRFNSFAAQLLDHNDLPWLMLPYWEIRTALETPPPQDAAAFECGLWVATEWLTRCGQLLRKDLGSTEALSKQEKASIAPGPLCDGISPQGIKRWQFWRSRLARLASAEPRVGEGGAGQPALSVATLDRIAQAITVMDAVSSSA